MHFTNCIFFVIYPFYNDTTVIYCNNVIILTVDSQCSRVLGFACTHLVFEYAGVPSIVHS